VHGFDLTVCAPKSVSLVRSLRTDDVVTKAIADAHTSALAEAMEYLAAHAGYTRVHNAVIRFRPQ
jgi:TrwC relaxase